MVGMTTVVNFSNFCFLNSRFSQKGQQHRCRHQSPNLRFNYFAITPYIRTPEMFKIPSGLVGSRNIVCWCHRRFEYYSYNVTCNVKRKNKKVNTYEKPNHLGQERNNHHSQ